MRHIWICLIDGVIVRSGPVQPGDTMPLLLEKLMRVYPHMQTDSLKVVREDGSIFDSELWFASPSPNDPNRIDVDDILVTVGVVEGHLGVRIYHGKSPEDILTTEANTFPEKITEQMDFGIFNFAGDQLVSIEDMISHLGPQSSQENEPKQDNNSNSRKRGRSSRRPVRGRRGRNRRREDGPPQNTSAQGTPSDPGQTPATTDQNHPESGNIDEEEDGREGDENDEGTNEGYESSREEGSHEHSESERQNHTKSEESNSSSNSHEHPSS
jgi:hypothetical protein